ncbi:hypothetical protein GCM10007067_15250 [Lysobacter bugurensis]|uniref:Curli production assembly/transport component CsgG n=2 Tax=Cognatilysobacter bugurensis TaxID=543356 RepID=A0A918SYN1_9GAMM|nr:hypothetical protein GCM10007067_15250 [Lysobacter bugurensis]
MKNTIQRAALFAALMCAFGPSFAETMQAPLQEEGPIRTYLLVDSTINELQGQVGGPPAASQALHHATSYHAVDSAMRTVPGMSYGQAYGAGMAGGLIAGVIIEGAIQAERNRAIAPVRAALTKGVLQRAMLAALSKRFADEGRTVDKRVIVPSVDLRVIKRAVGSESPAEVFGFDAKGGPLVTLLSDNRRIAVQAELTQYAREKGRYVRQRQLRATLVSAASPADADALAYWSDQGARRVLETVDTAANLMVGELLAMDPAGLPEVGEDTKVDLELEGERVSASGVLLREDAGHVFLVTPGGWLRILPGRAAPSGEPGVAAVHGVDTAAGAL